MRQELSTYVGAKDKLLKLFGCESDLPVRVLTDVTWRIVESEGVSFLHYKHESSSEEHVSVIINREGEPWIVKRSEISLVVGIDCVRFAFILSNQLQRIN